MDMEKFPYLFGGKLKLYFTLGVSIINVSCSNIS
jgi:hypothetical protein